MKAFRPYVYSVGDCWSQLGKLEGLLRSRDSLEERKDILPFFRANTDLAACIGTYVSDLDPDLIAEEYDLFGDFVCDLAIGDSRSGTYLLVEFEDAGRDSLFVERKGKSTPEWSPRLEHGFSQVIDWFWRLSDSEKSDDYQHRFGTRHASIHGIVIAGRDWGLGEREKRRLSWRQAHTVVHSRKVSIITFDQLVRDLKYRLRKYREAPGLDRA